jgi:hypothetical protein
MYAVQRSESPWAPLLNVIVMTPRLLSWFFSNHSYTEYCGSVDTYIVRENPIFTAQVVTDAQFSAQFSASRIEPFCLPSTTSLRVV